MGFHVYELAIPLFIVTWLDVFNVSPAVLGTLVGFGYGLIGLGAIASGVLADSYGSKLLVLLSLGGMGGGFALISVATRIELLAVGLAAWGIGASLYHPAGLSLLTRGAVERGTALAYHGVAGNIGTALGPFAAAVMLTFLSWRTVAALFVVPAVLGLAMGVRFEFDESAAVDRPGEEEVGIAVSDLRRFVGESRLLFTGGFAWAFAIMLLHGIYTRGVFSFLPEILADLPLFQPFELAGESFEASQYVYAALLLVGAGGQYVGGKWTDRGSIERATVAAYAAVTVLSMAFIPASVAGRIPLLVVCGLIGFVVYLTAPIRQALVAKYAGSDVHGLSFGYTYLGVFGFGAVGASLAGFVLTYGNNGAFFAVFATISGITALLGGWLLTQ